MKRRAWPLYVMIVPGIVFVLLFRYYPMYGVVIAFQDFSPAKGFTGLALGRLGELRVSSFPCPNSVEFFGNTLVICDFAKIVADQIGAIILALLLNEARVILVSPHDSNADLFAAFLVLDRTWAAFC